MPGAHGIETIPSTPAVAASSSAFSQHPNLNNNTSHLPRELLALPLRALHQAETFTFATLPRHIARLVGLENMATHFWSRVLGAGLIEGGTAEAATQAAAGAGEGVADAAAQVGGIRFIDILDGMKKFGGFFSYVTSRWSLACLTVAFILNRITIYSSTRRHLSLSWTRRLALRIVPILLFASQILTLLRAIRCQTSPDYSVLRYGKPGKRLMFDYSGNGGFLYWLSSTLLPWETDQQSCSAVNMGQPANASDIAYGSFSLLWPVFLRLCFGHFVETLSCALQGRAVATEAGMSIFEHSLAFSEAESMISQSVGLGLFGLTKKGSAKDDAAVSADIASFPLHHLTRAQILERMNVTPELLLILLISCCNSLSSNILDLFGKQSRYRLVNTSIWGLCYMGAMVWGLLSGASLGNEAGVLKFPTVCIVGFVPHLVILLGILLCIVIYTLALTITAFSLPLENPQSVSLRERFALAHENMQGANQISNIRFNRYEDFYAALLRVGSAALNAAREAVFLNEMNAVVAPNMTWLEGDRLAEIEASRKRAVPQRDMPFEESVNFDIPEPPFRWESGYKREKKIEKPKNGSVSVRTMSDDGGVGAFRGAVRCYYGFAFFRGIFFLLLRWTARGFSKVLDRMGISARPQWLKATIGSSKDGAHMQNKGQVGSLDFWLLTDDGELELPDNDEFDVEIEVRKRERSNRARWQPADESRLDEKLYTWWKAGGSWGNQDQSPDYTPSDGDSDDTASVISTSSMASNSEWEEYESDGRRTPTPANPFPSSYSRESTPMRETLLDPSYLAGLLDPRDKETKQEARILAAHLTAERDGRIMTRSRYQKQMEREKARVLLSSRFSQLHAPRASDERRKPTPEEESDILESLILSRRSEASAAHSRGDGQTWASGASGLGPDGPPCVVCQTNPRSIITWPCRCLCVCEDCRVSLAMNNFGSCVTCRQEVEGFLRLWVP